MNYKKFEFTFSSGKIVRHGFTLEAAKILAQAEAIQRGWDYRVLESTRLIIR